MGANACKDKAGTSEGQAKTIEGKDPAPDVAAAAEGAPADIAADVPAEAAPA